MTRKPSAVKLSIALFALLPAAPARAAAPETAGSAATASAVSADSGRAAADSSRPAASLEDPLLPAILSPGEKVMWGEHGLMRITGIFPLTEASRENELILRRYMLTAHQIGGFITLASMLATVYVGQTIINGNESQSRLDLKSTLAWTTVGTYFTTASLSLLSPPPLVRRPGWSSVSTHKALAWVHFTGMIITPLLGTMIEDKQNLRLFHQISGYTTTVAFAGAMLVITF
jgi:hypothetical protein